MTQDTIWTKLSLFTTGENKDDGFGCLDADLILKQLRTRPVWADRINTLTCELGNGPSFAWFLMAKETYDEFVTSLEDNSSNAVNVRWETIDSDGEQQLTYFYRWYMINAFKAAPSIVDGPMVIHLADARWHLDRLMAEATLTSPSDSNLRWNIRRGGSLDDSTSKTDSDTWSWNEILTQSDQWKLAAAGPNASLTFSPEPTHDPENLYMEGMSALQALGVLANRGGHNVGWDAVTGYLKLYSVGGTQTGLEAQLADLLPLRTDERDGLAKGIGVDAVNVFADYELPDTKAYAVQIVNPLVADIDDIFGNYVNVWTTYLARDETAGVPGNQAEIDIDAQHLADTIFAQSAAQLAAKVYKFAGLIEFSPGQEIDRIVWRVRSGATTTEIRLSQPFFEFPRPHIFQWNYTLGVTNEVIAFGTTGTVRIWLDHVTDSGVDVEAEFKWLGEAGEPIAADTEVVIFWFAEKRVWRILLAACEPRTASLTDIDDRDVDPQDWF